MHTSRTARAIVGERRAFTRRVVASLAVIAVFLGLSLASAGTAAADTGYWRPYGDKNPITSSSSTWKCGSSLTFDTNVVAQTCAVRTPDRSGAQAALIVRNNRSSTYIVTAQTELRSTYEGNMGWWRCPSSGVAANTWSVCFGVTLGVSYSEQVISTGRVLGSNGEYTLPESGWL
jgi:hypothetical protein